jgi:hypothetical protein
MTTDSAYDQHIFWCVRAKRRVAGWVGLLGVAGMMKLIISKSGSFPEKKSQLI